MPELALPYLAFSGPS
ncbi:hypothetical protein CP10139811_1068A, partial [Chlamydia ibidis]